MAAKAGTSLEEMGTQCRCLHFPSCAPAMLCFASYNVPQSAEEEKGFLPLSATGWVTWVHAERGKPASWGNGSLFSSKFSSPASNPPRDSSNAIPQLVSAGLSSTAMHSAGCSPAPAQDRAADASQDPAHGEGIHSVQEKQLGWSCVGDAGLTEQAGQRHEGLATPWDWECALTHSEDVCSFFRSILTSSENLG